MIKPTYPGVYVLEKPSGVQTISAVATSVTAFVGSAPRGAVGAPTRIFTYGDFEAEFGAAPMAGELADQVFQFYQNRGGEAWVVRVADGALPATAVLFNEDGNPSMTLTANDAGVLGGQIQIEAEYGAATSDHGFSLRIYRRTLNPSGEEVIAEEENYAALSMDPADGNFVKAVVNGVSDLVTVESNFVAGGASGFSYAGVVLDPDEADAGDAIRQKLPQDLGGGARRGAFRIAVDGQAPAIAFVELPGGPLTAAIVEGAFDDAISAALLNEGLAGAATATLLGADLPASVDGGRLLRFQSAGGKVRLSSAPSDDCAVGLHLGVANGGLEADRYSAGRPAPTGVTARLHSNPSAPDFDLLRQFASADKSQLTTWTLTTPSGPVSNAAALSFGGAAGERMYVHSAITFQPSENIVGCFRNVAANLTVLASSIASEGGDFTAVLRGHRLNIRAETGRAPLSTLTLALASDGAGAGLPLENSLFNPAEFPENVAAYRLGDGVARQFHAAGQNGDDGALPTPADYAAAYSALRRTADIINILVLPRAEIDGARQSDAQRAALWAPASAFCRENRCFLIIDPPSDNAAWSDVQAATDPVAGVAGLRPGLVGDHAAIYWPRVRIIDPTGAPKTIDPGGTMAGHYAKVDSSRGVWFAPAGLSPPLNGVRGLEHLVTDPENGVTNLAAVDTLRNFGGRIVAWGARTVDGYENSPNSDWTHIPVRRTALMIEESLYRGLQFAVFKPNDERLWAQIRLAAGAFMNNLFRQGAFQGVKSSDAYYVRCDSNTTRQNDINLGVVNVEVGFAPLRPAEFVIITIQQLAGQIAV